MILLTGGAGFIGSNLHAALAGRGQPCIIADWLGTEGKWRNLQRHPPARLIRPDALDALLETDPALDAVIHLGAISETTATDGDLVWETNVELSWRLWRWCAESGTRFIYASSASTYGDGSAGFDDDPAGLPDLRPLNLYGWSKHAFDLRVAATIATGHETPPQWAGLKFFNVYGPNEYHKGAMKSVVAQIYPRAAKGEPARLFRSHRADVPDGGQKRDFVYVRDCVDMMLWLYDHPEVSGLFNIGSGTARSFADLAAAVFRALGQEPRIEFVDTPPEIRDRYQYFTEARMDRLRAAGYTTPPTTLEDGVRDYVERYLAAADPYR